jgi:hypothetical protein
LENDEQLSEAIIDDKYEMLRGFLTLENEFNPEKHKSASLIDYIKPEALFKPTLDIFNPDHRQ